MRPKALGLLALTLALTAPLGARANSDSLFTVGLGTAMGVNRSTPLGGLPETTFTTELSLKVKALHVFGFEFSYAPTDPAESASPVVFDGQFRLSALLYLVPTYPVTFYVKGGIGAGAIKDLFSIDGDTNSYHAGAGLDVHIGDNLVIGAEYLLLIPGIAGVKHTLSNFANDEIKRYQSRDLNVPFDSGAPPELTDFISADNFRVTLSARWYF